MHCPRGFTVEVKFVKTIEGDGLVGKTITLNLAADDTIGNVKALIENIEGIVKATQRLHYECNLLHMRYDNMRNHGKVRGYNIVDGSVIECSLHQ